MGRRQAPESPCRIRGWGGWKPSCLGALLAASVLSSCFLGSQAGRKFVRVVADPAKPQAGGNVTLTPQGAMNDSLSCRWYRESAAERNLILIEYGPPHSTGTPGALYSRREKIRRPDCSLHVSKLGVEDWTTFFVSLEKPGSLETGSLDLEVTGLPLDLSGRGGPGLPRGVVAGIVAACLLVVVAVGGMLYFQRANESP